MSDYKKKAKPKCEICTQMKRNPYVCRSHDTINHVCGICQGKGHALWVHCKLCQSVKHTTEKHPCKRCGQVGHSSKIHCKYCLENHKTADHFCTYCWTKGHDKASHQCPYCPEAHSENEHKCRLCGYIGHGEHIDHKPIEYKNMFANVLHSITSLPSQLIAIGIDYVGDGNSHQLCSFCKKTYHVNYPHKLRCYSCGQCGHETTFYAKCTGLHID